MKIYVAIDLETTGLDPAHDAITEIGAVKFRGDDVLEEWSSLVDPGRPIPPKITDLTGISNAMVRGAPPLNEALPRLLSFVRHLPVVGHNVAFDLGFLNRFNALTGNAALDTFELASILVPHAGRYGLGALADELGITLPATHRALDDARVTHLLFDRLFQRAMQIPVKVLEEIVRLGSHMDWGARHFFEEAQQAAGRGAFTGSSIGAQLRAKGLVSRGGPVFAPSLEAPTLHPADQPQPLDVAGLADMLKEGGALSLAWPNYEYRSQQQDMLQAVARTFNQGGGLLVEAGTGTGKSLAYLLPAVSWAYTNQERVVISTNTINLQEQLYEKDLPDVQRILPFEFRASVLKGRSHYLCPLRLSAVRQRGASSLDELRVLCRVLLWLPNTVSGDGDELFLPTPADRAVWARLSAETETCRPERCKAYANGQCWFYRARRTAEAAHLVIVNHALLLADVAVENRVLPDYRYLVVDEAHHLEDATTHQLSFQISRSAFVRVLAEIGRTPRAGRQRGGLLADLVGRVRHACPDDLVRPVEDFVERAGQAVEHTGQRIDTFFETLSAFAVEMNPQGQAAYSQRLRLTPAIRTQPDWSNVEIAWADVAEPLAAVTDSLARLGGALVDLTEYDIPDAEDIALQLLDARRNLENLCDQVEALVNQPKTDMIYWAEWLTGDSGRMEGGDALLLNAAPLHVGDLIDQHLFQAKKAVIMTSATLRTGGTFDFIRERLHAHDAEEMALGSPFDYKQSTLLYIVSDMPEPGQNGYQNQLDQALICLCVAMGGRTLILFTSYSQLRTTAKALEPALRQHDITVYEQGGGSSRRQLLDNFKASQRAVLLGTRSFWEGVDVPGQALSCLAIIRLPFAVPTDPIVAARSEQFDQPFTEYSVPDAILRFRQGFGRLIRTQNDRGVVAVLDRRLLSKSYGKTFLRSLPECSVHTGGIEDISQVVTEWMRSKIE